MASTTFPATAASARRWRLSDLKHSINWLYLIPALLFFIGYQLYPLPCFRFFILALPIITICARSRPILPDCKILLRHW
jgi:hypothetical protein